MCFYHSWICLFEFQKKIHTSKVSKDVITTTTVWVFIHVFSQLDQGQVVNMRKKSYLYLNPVLYRNFHYVFLSTESDKLVTILERHHPRGATSYFCAKFCFYWHSRLNRLFEDLLNTCNYLFTYYFKYALAQTSSRLSQFYTEVGKNTNYLMFALI